MYNLKYNLIILVRCNMLLIKNANLISMEDINYELKDILVNEGKIVGIGTHKELLDNCLVYSEIYNSQFKEEE